MNTAPLAPARHAATHAADVAKMPKRCCDLRRTALGSTRSVAASVAPLPSSVAPQVLAFRCATGSSWCCCRWMCRAERWRSCCAAVHRHRVQPAAAYHGRLCSGLPVHRLVGRSGQTFLEDPKDRRAFTAGAGRPAGWRQVATLDAVAAGRGKAAAGDEFSVWLEEQVPQAHMIGSGRCSSGGTAQCSKQHTMQCADEKPLSFARHLRR